MNSVGKYILVGMASAASVVAIDKIFFNSDKSAIVIEKEQTAPMAIVSTANSSQPVNFREAAKKTVDAVVHVKTAIKTEGGVYRYSNPIYDFMYGPQYREPEKHELSSGSGVIISSDGYIVTNNHVIEKSNEIEIVLNDNRTFTAEVVGKDPVIDIALLKIKEENLPFLNFGDSENVEIGDWVLAVGNPFNLRSTVTAGIVSAKARNINILSNKYAIEAFIQTDAAVNPGNSGGALVTAGGELIGINTAIASNTGSFTGYSFAIPSNIVKKVVTDLIEFGKVQRAYIGVNVVPVSAELAEKLKLDEVKGIYISGVLENGAAATAGLREGDIILEINDKPVNSHPQLQEQISQHRPGDTIELSVKRDKKVEKIRIKLTNKYGKLDVIRQQSYDLWGATITDPDSEEFMNLRIGYGQKLTDIGEGKFKSAGIKNGFIITAINRTPIYTADDVVEYLTQKQGLFYIEGIYPNGFQVTYVIE